MVSAELKKDLNKQKMNLEEEFKKEKGRTYWAEGCDYGSYNDDYVNWLKQKLALTIPVVSNHVCKCTKTTQVNKINDSWICTECNRPIQQ